MKETAADDKAVNAIRLHCTGPLNVYKHNDRGTKGMPDVSVTWAEHTSWLEFKMLKGEQSVHTELDPLQLVHLVRLEHASSRAWVIAYRAATKTLVAALDIFRPSALLHDRQPVAREFSSYDNLLRDLQIYGVARFEGFDHGAVAQLIVRTHTN